MFNLLLGHPPAKRADDGDLFGSRSYSTDNYARRIQTLAGTRVDEEIALTYSAVWACTRILCEPISGLPLHLYRKTDTDGRERASDEPLFDLLDVSPNPDMGASAFREGRTGHQVNWGNGFAEIESDRTGGVAALWPVHPARVRPTWLQDGVDRDRYPYMIRNDDMTLVPMRRDELLHVPGVFPEDGTWGKGVIAYGRERIGGGMSVDRHGDSYFASGAQPKGTVVLPAMLIKSQEQRAEYRKEWRQFHGSPDSNEVMLLPPDSKYEPIPISNEDSQFLETKKLSVAQIAQFYRVPVYMLGIFEMAAARASIEAQGIEFVMYSLMPWLKKWEEQLNLKLLTPAQRKEYFIEHNVAALLRGSTMERYNAYRIAITTGFMTINQVCRLENLPGIGPAGDVNYVPLNMTSAEAMYEDPPQPADPAGGKPAPDPAAGDIDDPKGQTPGAFLDWAKQTGATLADRRAGRTRRKRSILIHDGSCEPEALRTAARNVLTDVLSRFAVKEAKAAERAAKGDFEAWATAFYPKHADQLASALRSPAALLTAIGVTMDPAAAAAAACTQARATIETAYNADTPAQFATRLASWPAAFAEAAATEILGKEVSAQITHPN